MAMLKNKLMTFSMIMVCLVMVSPLDLPQFEIRSIRGVVRCSVNGDTSAPEFPYADVQLQCNGTVLRTTTTDRRGQFFFVLDSYEFPVPTLLSDCQLAVTTPLSACNPSLPSVGQLRSNLTIGPHYYNYPFPVGFNLA